MSLESLLSDLKESLDRNTAALLGGTPAAPSRDEPKADDKPAGRSRRSAVADKADAPKETVKAIDEKSFKEAVAKFLDVPEGKDGDAEYEKRATAVIDPIFAKAGAKELVDLPEEFWQPLLDAIAEYEKPAEASTRRPRTSR